MSGKETLNTNIQTEPSTTGQKSVFSRRPEILSPAGDWDCARAAVENGADAIYFGLERFNARMRAHNFTIADLDRLMAYLHERGAKGYVTFNILVFENELQEAKEYLKAIIAAGVDAAIVQDAGVCRLIREISPDFPIHASTQMTISSLAGVQYARQLGCSMIAMARECSIKELEQIQQAQAAEALSAPGPLPPIPLEVFVHGALCVAYSGQCLTSESLGGRSANRGVCAQACRMAYDMVVDGKTIPLGDRRYLLSPQDLSGLEVLPDLIRIGIHTLKIEGRLKTPEYVANITQVYRQAIDALCPRPDLKEENSNKTPPNQKDFDRLRAESRYRQEMAFSRGLYTGWLRGIDNQKLVHARFGKKRGVFLGVLTQVRDHGVALKLEASLRPGDGVVFDAGAPDQNEEGGRVYQVEPRGRETWLRFGQGDINFKRLHPGDKVWKTSDPLLEKQLRRSFTQEQPHSSCPIDITVRGAIGQPLIAVAQDELGHVVDFASTQPLTKAEKQPLHTARLREQLGRLGGTIYVLRHLRNLLPDDCIVPVSELNQLRRNIVQAMSQKRAEPCRWTMRVEAEGNHAQEEESKAPLATGGNTSPPAARLIPLVRNMAQLEVVLEVNSPVVYCEFEDPKAYRDAVQRVRQSKPGQCEIWVAPPRITKPGEDWILKQVRSSEPDGFLVRNYDHLDFYKDQPCIADFSLNVANSWSAAHFMERYRVKRITASYDLNAEQLKALLTSAPPSWFEVTIHQHMPMFHMEHCVFCAFLSQGTDYRNCGRPCEKHQVQLRDRVGAEHPVLADAGCRNTVFNSLPQTGAAFAHALRELGLSCFRIEFLRESPSEVRQTWQAYHDLLSRKKSAQELWVELKALNHIGVTRGPKDSP